MEFQNCPNNISVVPIFTPFCWDKGANYIFLPLFVRSDPGQVTFFTPFLLGQIRAKLHIFTPFCRVRFGASYLFHPLFVGSVHMEGSIFVKWDFLDWFSNTVYDDELFSFWISHQIHNSKTIVVRPQHYNTSLKPGTEWSGVYFDFRAVQTNNNSLQTWSTV